VVLEASSELFEKKMVEEDFWQHTVILQGYLQIVLHLEKKLIKFIWLEFELLNLENF